MTGLIPRLVVFLGRSIVLSALAIVLKQNFLAQSVSTSDDAQLREVTRAYYYEFEKPTLDGQFVLWSPRSKDDSSNREQMTDAFNNYWDKMKVQKFEIERVRTNGDKAEVRLLINLRVLDKRNGKPVGGWFNRDVHLTHRLEKENGKWLLMEQIFTSEVIADEILAASTDTERTAIVSAEKESLDIDVVNQYSGKSLDLIFQDHDYQRGVSNLKFAIGLAEKFDDKRALADIYSYLGLAYEYMGDYGLSLLADIRYKEMSEEDGDQGGVGNALNSLAADYTNLGMHEQALDSIQKAILIKSPGKVPVDRPSRELSNLAETYLNIGENKKAIETFQQVLDYSEKNKLDRWQAVAYSGLAKSFEQTGDLLRAQEYSGRALQVAQDSKEAARDKGLILDITERAADIALALGKFDEAIALSERAIVAGKQFKFDDLLWRPKLTAARALIAMGKIDQARNMLNESIAIVENAGKRSLGGENNVQSVLAERAEPYRIMAALNASQGNALEALSFADKARARVLLATMSGARVSPLQAMTADERKTERDLSTRVAEINRSLQRVTADPRSDKEKSAALQQSLDDARNEYEVFRTKVIAAHPQLMVQLGDVRPLDNDVLNDLLRDDRTVIAEYLITDDISYVFAISKDRSQKLRIRAIPLPGVKAKELKTEVASYRSALSAGDLSFRQNSRALYDQLIKPFENELAGKSNIVFVPDRAMWEMPIEALQNARGQYLVEEASVSFAPSISVLREMNAKVRTEPRASSGLELLAFGNPLTGTQTQKRVEQVFMDEKLDPLPEAQRLVNTLAKMYGPKRSKVFTGPAAREEVAKSEAPKYRIIQFATHGIINDVSPMYSHLVLAQDDKDPNEDGLLEAWELKDLDLKADMVILSACDTARGKISNGEGIIGMTWAAFIAGAPTTVASQWKVESSSTTELMIEFHRQLLTGKVSKAEALRRAQLKLMRDPKYKHPSYWAAWVIIGDAS